MFEKIVSHRLLFLISTATLLVALPLSKAFMSIGLAAIGINWVLEGNFKEKWHIICKRKAIWIFMIIYLVHLAGLLYTSDFEYGLIDLRKKIPLFLFPLVFGTTEKLNPKEFKFLLTLFIMAVFAGTMVSMMVLFGWIDGPVQDIRDISIFISHIRFSLMINFAIVILLYFLRYKKENLSKTEKIAGFILVLWFVVFLGILKSFTGIVVFGAVFLAFAIVFAVNSRQNIVKTGILLFFLAIMAGTGIYIYKLVNDFYSIEEIKKENLSEKTKRGNPYSHDFSNKQTENGHYTWLYVCEKELEQEWNKISSLKYNGKDHKGQLIRYTLIRYLTSKGLKKDAEGIQQLSKNDIELIEQGFANHIYGNKFAIYPKIYEVIWQIDYYLIGGNPSGHSITMRLEYLKVAREIIKDNFFYGVGTGDVSLSFHDYYEKTNSPLLKKYRLRTHNQLVTFFLTFGILGFIIILLALVLPVLIEKGHKNILFMFFSLIAFVSMLDEDTLENHAGIIFFALFYSLLLFSHPLKRSIYGEKIKR